MTHYNRAKTVQSIRLSILIVNWNGRELILHCLTSLRQAFDVNTDEVIVVDNGSTDGSVEAVKVHHPWVTLIANKHNVGYARANNQAFSRSRGTYVLLLNPDTQVRKDSLNVLVRALESLPSAGAVTAKLVGDLDEEERYIRAFPTLATAVLTYTFVRKIFPTRAERVLRTYHMLDTDLSYLRTVPQPPGACLMLRRSILGKKFLDRRFPLYFNDVDLCKRIWDSGYKIYHVPDAEIVHTPNRGGLNRAGTVLEIEHAVSLLRYFRKHQPIWKYWILYLTVNIHYLLGFCVSTIKKLLGQRPFPVFDKSALDGLRLMFMLISGRSFFDRNHPTWQ